MSNEVADPAKATPGAGEASGAAPKESNAAASAASGAAADSTKPKAPDTKGTEGKPPLETKALELKLPEGSSLDLQAVERIKTLAKERGLSNEQAQELLLREHQAVNLFIEGQKASTEKTQNAWVEALKSDKDIGGVNFDKNVELSRRVVSKFGSDAFKKALTETGLGNHPEMVRFVLRIAEQFNDDTFVRPSQQGGGKKSPEEVFYGNQNKEA